MTVSLSNEFDNILRTALLEAQQQDWAPTLEAADPQPSFSPRYLRWEAKLLKDPFRYAERQAQPMWRKALRAAVWLLVAASVAVGGLWLNPSTRAWVEQVFFLRFKDHDEYRFAENIDLAPALNATFPSYIPDGFQETERFSPPDADGHISSISVTYTNENSGQVIYYTHTLTYSGMALITDNEHAICSEITVNGLPGQLYTATSEHSFNSLYLFDKENSCAYLFDAFIDTPSLIKMAESLVAVS